MGREYIDLLKFQSMMKSGVEHMFPSFFWLKAEISSLKVRSGGHCYLELSQSEDGKLVAKATAIIWASRCRAIFPLFRNTTGSDLKEGMTILASVQANYSQLYGFSLIINDIDPEFTIGGKELERRRTIERLQKEGRMELQKGLSMGMLPRRFAVISAEDAAGYRDFMRHLHENEFGFYFVTRLFPALMQGEQCPASIVGALSEIAVCGENFDAVLILRGGGGMLDLACFDDYSLAVAISECPLPVLTAIGHDQDFHVCDMVANRFVKTPTALADELLSIFEDADAMLGDLSRRIRWALRMKVQREQGDVETMRQRIRRALSGKIGMMRLKLDNLSARIQAADPRRVLERGYALVAGPDGAVLKSASGRNVGEEVTVAFSDGRLRCRISKVETNE